MPAQKKFFRLTPSRLLKIRIAILTLIGFILLELALYHFAFPNTYIGTIPVAGKTRNQIENILTDAIREPLVITVKGRPYTFSWRELGITPEINRSVRFAFYPNTRFFPKNLLLFATSFTKNRNLPAPVAFTDEFSRILDSLEFDYSTDSDRIRLADNATRLSYIANEERYLIDKTSLATLIHENFSKTIRIAPDLKRQSSLTKQVVDKVNANLARIFETPLTVTYRDRKDNYPVLLTGPEVKSVTTIRALGNPEKPGFIIDENKLALLLNSKKSLYRLPANRLPIAKTSGEVLGVVSERFAGSDIRDVTIPLAGSDIPASIHLPKYAEVSIKNQLMKVYSYGEIIREFRISTGLYYPTPTGQFRIINKAPNAFSKIYNVFMPWWMAFGYSNELNAYFGFHELPYWFTADGTKMQRPREKIGEPATGGCIALDIGEAKEFYDLADIGMPVSIVN